MFGGLAEALSLANSAKEAWQNTTEANDKMFEDIPYEPTYRFKPIPKLIYVRWADAFQKASGNLQYFDFKVRLPELIENYNELSLVSFGINWTFVTTVPTNWMIMVSELQASQMDSTIITSTAVSPTWIVPASTRSQNATPQSVVEFQNTEYKDRPYATSIRGRTLNELSFRIGGDDLQLVVSGGAGTGSYYCNMVMYAQ